MKLSVRTSDFDWYEIIIENDEVESIIHHCTVYSKKFNKTGFSSKLRHIVEKAKIEHLGLKHLEPDDFTGDYVLPRKDR